MIWLVWRHHRAPLLVALSVVGLVGLTALVGRPVALAVADGLGFTPCLLTNAQAPVCAVWWDFFGTYREFVWLLQRAVIALPVVAGAAIGAALFATEMARGTQGFTLTQSASRVRWWSTSLLAGVPVAVAAALATPAVAWSNTPFTSVFHNGMGPLQTQEFLSSGLMPAVYAVLAFCVAASAGLLLRNAVGALGLALVVVALVLGTTTAYRLEFLPAETVYMPIVPPGVPESLWEFPPESLPFDTGYQDVHGREISTLDVGADTCDTGRTWHECMDSLGLTSYYVRYQPPEHYWPIQAVEAAIVLALAAGALGAGLVGLRRRVH